MAIGLIDVEWVVIFSCVWVFDMLPIPVVVVFVLLDMLFICADAGTISVQEITAAQTIDFKRFIFVSPIAPRHCGWSRSRNERANIRFLQSCDVIMPA